MPTTPFIKGKNGAAILTIAGLLLFSFCGCTEKAKHEAPQTYALQKACAYLWTAQSDDGGWHSQTHGILRDGESLTPFILDALMNVPQVICQHPSGKPELAIRWIRNNVQSKIDRDSIPLILDYPNYSAAYALKVFSKHGQTHDTSLIKYLTDYLIAQQFIESRGIDSAHAAYGGWGFGETALQFGTTGHVDLSHTRRVLEALHLVMESGHPVFIKAQWYLKRVQNDYPKYTVMTDHLDGGFFTSIVTPETNKSQPVPGVPETWYSYATSTCDGLLALRASGVDEKDIRFVQAENWLFDHGEMRYPEGIPKDDPLQWHRVMKYYHLAVRAEACQYISCDSAMLSAKDSLLIAEQLQDGSFLNPDGSANKEDDPLLATALAVIALSSLNVRSPSPRLRRSKNVRID